MLGFVLAQTKATWPVMSVPCSLSARALNCADVPTAILVSVGCTSIRSHEIVTTIGCEPVRGVSVTANGGLEPLCTVMVVSARWVSTPAASKAEMRNCRSFPAGTVSVPVATPLATGKLNTKEGLMSAALTVTTMLVTELALTKAVRWS